jgi:hypothetical protein
VTTCSLFSLPFWKDERIRNSTSIQDHTVLTPTFEVHNLKQLAIEMVWELRTQVFQITSGHDKCSEPEHDQYSIIAYFDEAQGIGSLDAITNAFVLLKNTDVIGIYLLTASHLNYLAPLPEEMVPSAYSVGEDVIYTSLCRTVPEPIFKAVFPG